MFKAIDQARAHNYFFGGLSHTWMTYYRAQLSEDGVALNEWLMMVLSCDMSCDYIFWLP